MVTDVGTPSAKDATASGRAARGRAARGKASRAGQAALEIPRDRDPVALLDADTPNREPDLVPIRYGRMLVSPFTFYRGAAGVMANDLASAPQSGLTVQLCGDAHLSNFGGFSSPDRRLVFDLNDFDETLPGPFEWDVKRLATSFEIAARHRGFGDAERTQSVLAVLRAYRDAITRFATMSNLDVWYARLDVAEFATNLPGNHDKKVMKRVSNAAGTAHTKNSMKALAKLTHQVDGEPRINFDPPLIVPLDKLAGGAELETRASVQRLLQAYTRTLQPDRRKLLEKFRTVDIARKVVGVGSVGTRCWIVLLVGRDNDDPLFLQCKEAGPSVLEPVLHKSKYTNQGQRVVEGQRLIQAASDIFLGWLHVKAGLDGRSRDFYVRQLWDWKTSVDVESIRPEGLLLYAHACGWTLARAHARSGDAIAIAAYLGRGDRFDRAVAEFAVAYADLNEQDFQLLVDASRSGRITAVEGA